LIQGTAGHRAVVRVAVISGDPVPEIRRIRHKARGGPVRAVAVDPRDVLRVRRRANGRVHPRRVQPEGDRAGRVIAAGQAGHVLPNRPVLGLGVVLIAGLAAPTVTRSLAALVSLTGLLLLSPL